MKKEWIISTFLLVIIAFHGFGQNDEISIAKVSKINGKEIYVLNVPLRSYDVVFEVNTGLKKTSLFTDGMINEGISSKTAQFARKIQKKAKYQNINYDAVLYTHGKKAKAIKFTDKPGDNSGLAKVKEIEGVKVYIHAEPLREYEIVESKRGGIKAKSYFSKGLINNSIEEDVIQFVRKLTKWNKNLDGIIYSTGKTAISIIFN